ncbi:MAG: hypothetical protein J6W64_07995 [Bacilli bacterium]|nr:hypothetical protein [Bacilli bacterium]
MIKALSMTIHKTKKADIERNFAKYFWRVKVKDDGLKKPFKIDTYVSTDTHEVLLNLNWLKNYNLIQKFENQDEIDEFINETTEIMKDYLIDNQEIFHGEDGDYYLVGENE